ncbi:MAG TPA: energy transducer TonB [Rudaea sp.]|nr:energy transducer TonB [Rudaea sp.]
MTMPRWIFLASAAVVAAAVQAADKVQTIPPERVANYWLLDPDSAEANVPNSGYNIHDSGCAAVAYVIEKDGSTSHVKLMRLVPQSELGKTAVGIVAGMRFVPAKQNLGKDSIYTYVVIPFNLPDAASKDPADRATRERVLASCKLEGFGGKPGEDVIRVH